MDEQTLNDIRGLVDYVRDSAEERDWIEQGTPEDHPFAQATRVDEFLKSHSK